MSYQYCLLAGLADNMLVGVTPEMDAEPRLTILASYDSNRRAPRTCALFNGVDVEHILQHTQLITASVRGLPRYGRRVAGFVLTGK